MKKPAPHSCDWFFGFCEGCEEEKPFNPYQKFLDEWKKVLTNTSPNSVKRIPVIGANLQIYKAQVQSYREWLEAKNCLKQQQTSNSEDPDADSSPSEVAPHTCNWPHCDVCDPKANFELASVTVDESDLSDLYHSVSSMIYDDLRSLIQNGIVPPQCYCDAYGQCSNCANYAASLVVPANPATTLSAGTTTVSRGTLATQNTQSNASSEPTHTCHSQFYGFCSACADLAAATPAPSQAPALAKCECGSDAIGGGYHSTWCPKKSGENK